MDAIFITALAGVRGSVSGTSAAIATPAPCEKVAGDGDVEALSDLAGRIRARGAHSVSPLSSSESAVFDNQL